MARNKLKEEDRKKLALQIHEWNANRYDLFAITPPNEEDEFFGVMRFFFQEANQRVSTKCIRVSNTASTRDVISTLEEKFRPDMRMLSLPNYALYEVHVNGEERKLKEDEYPLVVQLNWGKDDREGRFLLKDMDEKTYLPKTDSITNTTEAPAAPDGGFKRKLSKREKKEQKKRDKEAKLKDKENTSPSGEGVAGKLYNEVPDTSFTRSISNPEAVMRKRRQLKLEKKLQQIRSKDGGPDQGGTLKIFGESIRPDIPYKTLLLSMTDNAAFVVKETLDKYGMEKDDPRNYCLIQTLMPPGGPENHGPGWGSKEYVLDEDDCPLAILMHTPPSKGTVMFQLKRRTADMPAPKKKRSASATRLDSREKFPLDQAEGRPQKLPFLVEIQPDGTEPYKARVCQLQPNGTEVGSEQVAPHNGQYIHLHGQDIGSRHCVFTFTEGLVTVTPMQRDAETFVNGKKIVETTILQHGMELRFGKMHIYRFCDPTADKVAPQMPPGKGTLQRREMPPDFRGSHGDVENFETTFDVDGHIETKAGPHGDGPGSPDQSDLLPCSIQYREEGEEAFLRSSVNDVNGNNIQFKLAPTYTMYMAMRYRLQKLHAMDMSPNERSHWINAFTNKIINTIQQTVQSNGGNASALSFWMANSSELLHFLKQDRDVCVETKPCQDQLAQVVQTAFHQLVDCMQADLHQVMPAFLDESMEDLQSETELGMYPRGKPMIGDVLQVLSSAMSLLRRCRVNAALTIQLFSQLFHFINMWLFNKLVLQPQLELCTASWGHKLKRRLGRVEIWAEKHGLELAADCHLARIIQAAHLLETPKGNADDSANISSTCFKLNSLQLRALLESYVPSPGEPRIPNELLLRVVSVAQSMSDELLRSEGREVRLEEDPDLQLPFLLPEDGYSCDIVKGVPGGLADFLAPMTKTGLCRFDISPDSSGSWTAYMGPAQSNQPMEIGGQMSLHPPPPEPLPSSMPQQPEVLKVIFNKVNGSIGLSIVAAKGESQADRGIYVKSVVAGGGAALDGRLHAGDQLLKVDGHSLVGLTQEKAAEIMMHTGQTVNLEVAKQGAIYHGLTSLLNQPSPTMRGPPNQGMSPGGAKVRPRSEDMNKLNAPSESPYRDGQWADRQKPLQMQHGARSSPNLPNTGEDPRQMEYNMPQGRPGPPAVQKPPPGHQYMVQDPVKSKSTTNLDNRMQYDQPPPAGRGQPMMPQYQSHPDLNRVERDKTYENYPVDRPRPGQPPARQPGVPPGGQALPGMQHGLVPMDRDMRGAKSLGNIRQEEPAKPDTRPHSGDFDRRQMQHGQNRPQDPQRRGPGRMPEGPNQSREVPRSQPNNQQYQPNFFQHTQQNSPSQIPMEQMRITENQRGGSPEKPVKPQQPTAMARQNLPRDVPKMDVDPYKTQPQFYDGRQKPSPGAYPPGGDYRGYRGNEPGPGGPTTPAGHPYQRKENSPDLPPPPPSVPPPEDDMDLPPPPSSQERDHPRPDQDGTRHRDVGQPSPHVSQASPMRPNMPGFPQSRPPPQQHPVNSPNYYNVDVNPQKFTSPMKSESQPTQSYHYVPRPAPPQNVDRSIIELQQSIGPDVTGRLKSSNQPAIQKKPPPVSAKPMQIPPKPVLKGSVEAATSPWGREQKEKEKKYRDQEVRARRQLEIRDLGSRPGLSHEEQERLQRLRLDEEFDRRVQEMSESRDDEDDDDTDMTRTAMGRAKVLDLMQRDAERRQQQMQENKEQRQYQEGKAEAEKIERQERRLAQFDQERQEEKMRQLKRQEKKAQETEDYLRKQRELRESQRQAFEEQRRIQKEEQEKLDERQKEELRKKREMEQEQMREMQAAREAEEKHMREVIKRQDQEREYRASDKYSSSQYDDTPTKPSYRSMERQGPPAPPERKSSRDIYGNRPVSMSNLGKVDDPGGPMRSTVSTSAVLPPHMQEMYSKKSVSFDTNLTREIQVSRENSTSSELSYRQNSTSSEASYRDYQPQEQSPYQPGYQATGHPMTGQQPAGYPATGQQPSGYPTTDQPPTGYPATGQPPTGYPATGQPPTGYPATSQPPTGHPAASQQPTGYPATGQPPSGYPATSQPPAGHPAASQQPTGYPAAGQPPSGYPATIQQPTGYPTAGPPPSGYLAPNQPPATSMSSSHQPPFQRPMYGSSGPNMQYAYTPGDDPSRTPQGHLQNTSVTNTPVSGTPGVIGMQEVYRDPRDRIAATRLSNNSSSEPQRMSFRDKMKMFAKEAGENTPQERSRISRAQQALETQYSTP